MGRKKGVNKHGVTFTPEEIRDLRNAVNRANYARKKMLKEEGALPRVVAGRVYAPNQFQLQLMGKESDFIISKRSANTQGFKSKAEYNRYMKNLERVTSPDYIDERTKLYKRNHMKALDNVYGDDAADVKMKIRMMKPADYRKYVQSEEFSDISFVYDPSEAQARLNRIRAGLGMKLKELPY